MKKILLLFMCSISLSSLTHPTMQTIKHGYLFSVEGTEGCGKTTLIKNLTQILSNLNFDVVATREPGSTELGKTIRSILMNRSVPTCTLAEFLLFAADRAQHFEEFIMPHLAQGYIVISDRMADSSLVYQGYVKGLNQSMIKTINSWAMQQRQPDLVLYLKIDCTTALCRVMSRNQTEAQVAFEQEILQKKQQLVDGYDEILSNRDNVIILDATASTEELTNQALEAILHHIQKNTHDQ